MRNCFSSQDDRSDARSLGSSIRSGISLSMMSPNATSRNKQQPLSVDKGNLRAWVKGATAKGTKQYTIKPKKRFESSILNWMDRMQFPFMNCCAHEHYNPDAHNYRPGRILFRYINWTFTGTWSEVILTFLMIYFAVMLIFAFFLWIAGNAQPACIVAAGEPFGANSDVDATRFSDAFALSWTTFTTVGYGMIYTAVGGNFHPNGPGGKLETEPYQCTWVVTLCTMEAFLGLLYAGMCAAILFGKVNRVQSHANLIFSNSVCLQYEWVEEEDEDENEEEDDDDDREEPPRRIISDVTTREDLNKLQIAFGSGGEGEDNNKEEEKDTVRRSSLGNESVDEENPLTMDTALAQSPQDAFIDQFNGCPVLKFQVVNELCNMQGAEIVDAIMKVVGIKFKGSHGRITRSEYVRVNLVDFEHPFFSRVWHGVHILDGASPLLNDKAKQKIRENNGSWPSHWFTPDIIKEKLEFHDLIVTVAGISNISAVTVHAYKRYKIGDVLIGYNFAPLVFRDKESDMLVVDKTLVNDVREQAGLEGEDLSVRRSIATTGSPHHRQGSRLSTIRITKATDHDTPRGISMHRVMSARSLIGMNRVG
jgi:hypothetical protein